MLLHVRRVVVVGPDEMRVVVFSPSEDWKREITQLVYSMGDRSVLRRGHVLLAKKENIDSEIGDRSDIMRCAACDELRECSVYEDYCEEIADSLSLLSVSTRRDGQWAWVAPESVIEISKVAYDPDQGSRMRSILGLRDQGRQGVVDGLFGLVEEELQNAKGFLFGAKKRVKKKVVAAAGQTAGRIVDDVVDNVVDIGTAAFKNRFKKAAQQGARSEGRSVMDEWEEAAMILGVHANASAEEVERAWKAKASQYHPDRNQGNEKWAHEQMSRVNRARDVMRGR